MSFGTAGNSPHFPFGGPQNEPSFTPDLPELDASGLHILDRDQCFTLLGTAGVGPLTVTRQALPIALPIGYSVHQGSTGGPRGGEEHPGAHCAGGRGVLRLCRSPRHTQRLERLGHRHGAPG